MTEAYIVATARSPIGRARKGSLAGIRPDDLAARMVRAALETVPALDPGRVEDLMLGCGQPAGEHGMNLARIVSVLLGLDGVPGTTVNRYCSSSLQTTRMAFHAIKAGEGDVFVSAGVESVSRYAAGFADVPSAFNPVFSTAGARTAARAEGGAAGWTDPHDEGKLPDPYIAIG
ncbi:MAG: beta-ketoacyl synthase N-terminal-like domain-containing protein, partial [Microbacterium sp.]